MTTVAEKLHKWSLQELNIVSEGGLNRIPNVQAFEKITKGKNKKIWNYVINHVKSQATVAKVKRTLFLKKQLKEQQDCDVYCEEYSVNNEKLKESLSKAKEKREYLLGSLSTIEDRILDLDQNVRKTKEEIFQINQKTALLEYLKQLYDEKNSNLKKLFSLISSYKCILDAYQTSKIIDKDLSYDFLFGNKVLCDVNIARMKDLVIKSSSIFKKSFIQDVSNMTTLKENFKRSFIELKSCGILLIDFVAFLKMMSKSDLQQFTILNAQNLSVNEYIFDKSNNSQVNNYFARLESDCVYNYVHAKQSKGKIEQYSIEMSKASRNAVEKLEIETSDLDCELKLSLLEKQAENDALVVSNNCLESYLENLVSKTELILKNARQKKLHAKDVTDTTQLFFKDVDLTFNLLYTFLSVTQNVSNCLKDLKEFSCEELFKLPLPEETQIEELKECFSSERKYTWDYCTKTKLIEPLFTESSPDNELPSEICQSLHIQPYQNISVLCEYWACFKQKLHAEMAANLKTSASRNDVNVSEIYSKILEMLEKTKYSTEKGVLTLTYGTAWCTKNRSLIQEWWDQNAQYIPHIEYEGKTLKMWIDILSVLSDFELQNHV